MRRIVLLLMLPAALADVVDDLEKARSVERVRKLQKRIEPRISTGYENYRRVCGLAEALARFDDCDEAVAVIGRHVGKFLPGQIDGLRKLEAEILADAGRIDEAIAVAEVRLAEADSEKARFVAHGQLGELEERKEDWKAALHHYSVGVPESTARCGTCADAVGLLRAMAIVRCRFHLGEVDTALTMLREMMVSRDAAGKSPRGGLLYCEYSARSGRIAEARKVIAKISAEHRGRLLRDLDVAEAFAKRNAVRMLALVEVPERRHELRAEWTARLLAELGDAAMEVLKGRIADGSNVAQVLARYTGRADLVPVLEARLAATEDHYERETLSRSIEGLGGSSSGR